MSRKLKICMIEACEDKDVGSIGAFYVRHHAQLAGYDVDVLRKPAPGYDVEMISCHHCTDFPRLADMKKYAPIRLVGGHPMQSNPRPIIHYADAVGIGEGETWIKRILNIISETGSVDSAVALPGTIVTKYWHDGDPVPAPNVEVPLPDNPPYLNHEGTGSMAWYIEMARGCPFKCDYCELGNTMPYRIYTKEQLKNSIDLCNTGITRKINFYAPDEASHPDYQELYDYLYTRGFSAAFSSMRVDSILRHPPTIKTNHLIRVGIDGMTEATRRRVHKNISDDQIVEYFRMFIERGHVTFKMFMIFGYPWDKPEDFDEWAEMMERIFALPITKNINLRIKWTPFIPQPGTPLAGVTPNYDFNILSKIYKWHDLHRNPVRRPGVVVVNDGIMSYASHQYQCRLCAGDENVLKKHS